MRYLFVRCTSPPKEATACGFCCTPLGLEYVRDLETRIVYHSFWCMEIHTHQSLVKIGGYDATQLLR